MRSSGSRSAVLAIGLVAAVGCVFLAARLFGFTSNSNELLTRRIALCEGLSISCSQLVVSENWKGMQQALQQAVLLHPDLESVAVIDSQGNQVWRSVSAETDSDNMVVEPIEAPLYNGGEPWGELQLNFTRPRFNWFLAIALPVFVAAMCFVIFTVLLRYILQRLSGSDEPSLAVQRSLDSMSDSVVMLDDRERIVLANQAFSSLTGHSLASLKGSKIWALPWRADGELPWKATLRDGVANLDATIRLMPQRREPRRLSINCAPLQGTKGQTRGAVVSLHDVTEQENQLRDLRIARTASHDSAMRLAVLTRIGQRLMGPAGSVLSCVQGLRRGLAAEPEAQRNHYNVIFQSGRSLVSLLRDIHDLQRMETGKLVVSCRTCSPHSILAEVYRTYQSRAEQKGVKLKFASEGSIPMAIHTDPERLERVLAHLVDNAVRYSQGGVVSVKAKVERQQEKHQLRIDVTDEGAGIAPDLLNEVFTPFVDLGGGKRGGLGLPVSKRCVEVLGGQLSMVSELGAGSTVSFRVDTGPLKSVSSRPLRNHDLQPRRVEEERTITSRFTGKVLVADNDYHVRQSLALSLEPLGLEVILASNGRDALRAARRLDFNLVLLDTQLAALDGLAATRLLRRHGFSNPIVAMTDNPMEQDDCRQAGFTRLLLKPVQLDHLLLCLQRTLATIQVEPTSPDSGQPLSKGSKKLMLNLTQGLGDAAAATPETQTVSMAAMQDDENDDEDATPDVAATSIIAGGPMLAGRDEDSNPLEMQGARGVEKTQILSRDELDLERPSERTDYLASSDSDTRLPDAIAKAGRTSLPALRFLEEFELRRLSLAELVRRKDLAKLQHEAERLQAAAAEAGFQAMADTAGNLKELAEQGNTEEGLELVLERLDALAECILSPGSPGDASV